jgi:hypothetical protein
VSWKVKKVGGKKRMGEQRKGRRKIGDVLVGGRHRKKGAASGGNEARKMGNKYMLI